MLARANICEKASIDRIWAITVPLQVHEDLIISQKAVELIEAFLCKEQYSTSGHWEFRHKKSVHNYERYLQLSKEAPDPKYLQAKKDKCRYG